MDKFQQLSLGIPELDAQHGEIDNFIQSLQDVVGNEEPWDQIHLLVTRLYELLRFHFSVEESLMQIVSYPFVIEHRSAHQKILHELDELMRVLLKGDGRKDKEISVRAKFLVNVDRHDKVFAEFIKANFASLTKQ